MKAKTSAMISLDKARMLVAHLEREEFEQADTILADVCAPNAAALFDKVGAADPPIAQLIAGFSPGSQDPRPGHP